jgi:imidazolonepropionase-like amidohydrolase
VIDGTGAGPVENGAVLIENGTIKAVGPLASLPHVDGAEEIDAQGGYILPGLIDTHVHVMAEGMDLLGLMQQPFSFMFYQAIQYLARTLECGVTTVRDAGGADAGVKKAVEDGIIPGPRMQISIAVLSTTGGHGDGYMPAGYDVPLIPPYPGNPSAIADGVEEVRKKVREILRAGAEVIKVCSTGGVLSATDHPEFTQYTIDELKVMVEEARFRKGLRVMAHAQGAEGIKNAIRAGIHSIEHGMFIDDEAVELMLEHGTFLVPTLVAPLGVIEEAAATGKMPEYGLRKARETIDAHRESITKAYKAGVKIAMGTDAGVVPHGTNLRELGLMADLGMTPMDVIVATTKTAAECLGWEDRVGTLEAGKLADVVVTSVDPLTRIHDLADVENIALVIKGGEIVKDRRPAQVLAGV